jgi:hypothetical protein
MTAAAAALTLWIAIPRDDHRRSIERAPAQAHANAPTPPAAPEPRPEERRAYAERGPASAIAAAKPQERADNSRNKAGQETAGRVREQNRRSAVSVPSAEEAITAPQVAAPTGQPLGATPANAVQPSRDSSTALMAKATSTPRASSTEIVSPDRSSRWRPGPAGSVEYSSDGGSSWQTLSTGVSSELTAGASPSSSVCWLVGRGGTVLLSTDGRRFQRAAFPAGVDLVSVSATDARTATVTTADGRRFSTADGGLTWRQS